MKAATPPVAIPVPFAAIAPSGEINVIPMAPGGLLPGQACYETGFPPTCFLDPGAGGVAPLGADFNGLANAITQSIAWVQGGGQFIYNSTFAANVSGYPQGAILQRADLTGGWINTIDANVTNPDTGGAGWLPYGGSTKPLALTVAGANITLNALQAASRIITLTGTPSANVNLFFPAWAGIQWLVVNDLGVSAFTVTATTSSGTGVALVAGENPIYGDGTNIYTAANPTLPDAPSDTNVYGRKDGAWVVAVAGSPLTNPMTAPWDIIVGSTAGNPARMGLGANGTYLGVSGGALGYVSAPAGFANPMSASGDLILGGTSGSATRLGIGSNTEVLTSNGTTASWSANIGFNNPMTASGDLMIGGSSGAPTRLAAATNGYVLTLTSGAPAWVANTSLTNPMSAIGDMIVGGTAGAPSRTAIGAVNSVWISNGTTPSWVAASTALTDIGGIGLGNTGQFTANQSVVPVSATTSGTVTPAAGSSNNFQYVLSGNLTIANPTGLVKGMVLNFCVDENSTGGYTITLGNLFFWPGGTTPTWITTANALNFFSAYYDGTQLRCSGGAGYVV